MKRIIILVQALLFLILPLKAIAADDIVINALVDELDRSMKELHMEDQPKPYFISYFVKETEELTATSCLGAKAVAVRSHHRIFIPVVRLGDYCLDSSIPLSARPKGFSSLTVDDDYAAIRRTAWLMTDWAYKNAIKDFEWKKSYLKTHTFVDRLDDMTKEPAIKDMTPISRLSACTQQYTALIENLSALFKKYPSLQKSKVSLIARNITYWCVNSEGTRTRNSQSKFAVIASAAAQCADGMPISDNEVVAVAQNDQLPGYDHLKNNIEDLAKRLTALRQAPMEKAYCGPVLFQGQAAAEFFAQALAPNFGFAESYVGDEGWQNPLKDGVGRRVLPKGMTVIDDPLLNEYEGKPIIGGYRFDDEGVPAQKIVLVEDGVLKNYCQSRIPTSHCSRSNGHSLGGHGVYNVLQISSTQTISPEQIRQRLTELAKDAGLKYVLVIERMEDKISMPDYPLVYDRDSDDDQNGWSTRTYDTPAYSCEPSKPIVAYRLYIADGRKELIRGLEFNSVSLRAFRDIQGVCSDTNAYVIEPQEGETRHLITPSYVVGELELKPVKAEYDSVPIMDSPLAAESALSH